MKLIFDGPFDKPLGGYLINGSLVNGPLWVGALLLWLVLATVAYGHGGASGIVKERMEMMKILKDASKDIGEMLKGEQPFDVTRVVKQASTIHEHGGRIPGYFPKGSLHGPTEALPAIWEDWTWFEEVTRQLQAESARLIEVADGEGSPSKVGRQFARVGRACRSCHEAFRQKRKH